MAKSRIAEDRPQVIFKKALLLEDDTYFAEFLQENLANNCYYVTVVSNGLDGMHEIARTDFDAIICDMRMPLLSGDQFFEEVRRAKPYLCKRFIFISGDPTKEAMATVSEISQINPLLKKPFHISALFDALKKLR